jgi:hypothetical protein
MPLGQLGSRAMGELGGRMLYKPGSAACMSADGLVILRGRRTHNVGNSKSVDGSRSYVCPYSPEIG